MGKGGTVAQIGLAAVNLASTPIQTSESGRFVHRLSRRLVHMRCTDGAVISLCMAAGAVAIFLQTLSLSSEHWLHTIEPRLVNLTDERGKQLVGHSLTPTAALLLAKLY